MSEYHWEGVHRSTLLKRAVGLAIERLTDRFLRNPTEEDRKLLTELRKYADWRWGGGARKRRKHEAESFRDGIARFMGPQVIERVVVKTVQVPVATDFPTAVPAAPEVPVVPPPGHFLIDHQHSLDDEGRLYLLKDGKWVLSADNACWAKKMRCQCRTFLVNRLKRGYRVDPRIGIGPYKAEDVAYVCERLKIEGRIKPIGKRWMWAGKKEKRKRKGRWTHEEGKLPVQPNRRRPRAKPNLEVPLQGPPRDEPAGGGCEDS